MKTNLAQILPIDLYLAFLDFNKPEKRLEHRGLASSGAADNTHFHSCVNFETQVLNRRLKTFSVAHSHFFELHIAAVWPVNKLLVFRQLELGLQIELRILKESLRRGHVIFQLGVHAHTDAEKGHHIGHGLHRQDKEFFIDSAFLKKSSHNRYNCEEHTNHVEAKADPAIHHVEAKRGVCTLFLRVIHVLLEVLGPVEDPDRSKTVYQERESTVHGSTELTVELLSILHRSVTPGQIVPHWQHTNQDPDKQGRAYRTDCYADGHGAEDPHRDEDNIYTDDEVNHHYILAEASDDPSNRIRVEKEDVCAQDSLYHVVMEVRAGCVHNPENNYSSQFHHNDVKHNRADKKARVVERTLLLLQRLGCPVRKREACAKLSERRYRDDQEEHNEPEPTRAERQKVLVILETNLFR